MLFYNGAAADDQGMKKELAAVPTHGGEVVKLAVPVALCAEAANTGRPWSKSTSFFTGPCDRVSAPVTCATCRLVRSRVTRVLARGAPSSHRTTRDTLMAAAVQTSCKPVFAKPM